MRARVLTSSVDASLSMRLLPAVLSLTAGSVDVISFLGLGGLFTAHITGNLVILASHIVNGGDAPLAPMLSVPVFMVVLGLTRLLVGGWESLSCRRCFSCNCCCSPIFPSYASLAARATTRTRQPRSSGVCSASRRWRYRTHSCRSRSKGRRPPR